MLSNRSRPFGDEGERAGVSIPPSGWSKTEGFQEHVILWRVNHSHVTGVLKIACGLKLGSSFDRQAKRLGPVLRYVLEGPDRLSSTVLSIDPW